MPTKSAAGYSRRACSSHSSTFSLVYAFAPSRAEARSVRSPCRASSPDNLPPEPFSRDNDSSSRLAARADGSADGMEPRVPITNLYTSPDRPSGRSVCRMYSRRAWGVEAAARERHSRTWNGMCRAAARAAATECSMCVWRGGRHVYVYVYDVRVWAGAVAATCVGWGDGATCSMCVWRGGRHVCGLGRWGDGATPSTRRRAASALESTESTPKASTRTPWRHCRCRGSSSGTLPPCSDSPASLTAARCRSSRRRRRWSALLRPSTDAPMVALAAKVTKPVVRRSSRDMSQRANQLQSPCSAATETYLHCAQPAQRRRHSSAAAFRSVVSRRGHAPLEPRRHLLAPKRVAAQ